MLIRFAPIGKSSWKVQRLGRTNRMLTIARVRRRSRRVMLVTPTRPFTACESDAIRRWMDILLDG